MGSRRYIVDSVFVGWIEGNMRKRELEGDREGVRHSRRRFEGCARLVESWKEEERTATRVGDRHWRAALYPRHGSALTTAHPSSDLRLDLPTERTNYFRNDPIRSDQIRSDPRYSFPIPSFPTIEPRYFPCIFKPSGYRVFVFFTFTLLFDSVKWFLLLPFCCTTFLDIYIYIHTTVRKYIHT